MEPFFAIIIGDDDLREGLELLRQVCPNMKLHVDEDGRRWCLHTDASEPAGYKNEDLLVCVRSALTEVAEKAQRASMN